MGSLSRKQPQLNLQKRTSFVILYDHNFHMGHFVPNTQREMAQTFKVTLT